MQYMNRVRRDVGGTRGVGRAPPASEHGRELDRLVWERTMRRLRASTLALGAVLLALLARMIVFGVTALAELMTAIIAILAISSLLLTRQGKRLEPRTQPRAQPRRSR